jgi:ABC-2 type transport system permease protein
MEACRNTFEIFRREIKSYFESPVAYVFLVAFLLLTGFLTFMFSEFYETGQADLRYFFFWHPWVYLLMVPAASMRLWSEERRSGTVELLLTYPVTLLQALVGKFLAAWSFLLLALLLTFPIVLTVMYLGDPDPGPIVGGYIGSFLLAGAYLSLGMLTSTLTKNQVVSFVLALMGCLFLLLAGYRPVTGMLERWAPTWLINGVAAFSVMPHFESFQRGLLDIRDLAYFLTVAVMLLFAAHLALENRKTA